MHLPCEQVVHQLLPAIRSLVAKELQAKGYTQTEIAELLGITQPAVSQYLSQARGKEVQRLEDDPDAYDRVLDLVDVLMDDAASEDAVTRTFCKVCLDLQDHDLFDTGAAAEEMLCLGTDLDPHASGD